VFCASKLNRQTTLGQSHWGYYRNVSHRFTDFKKSFLICESVEKKTEAEHRGIKPIEIKF
jgi:hypothetical protein